MSETDVILNRANVALARSQRLVASWLTPKDGDSDNNGGDGQPPQPKSEEELQREESDLFTPVPETLGLGAPLPSKLPDGSWNRAELDSNDALRRQLLGRNYQRVMKEKEKEKQAQKPGTQAGTGSGSGSGSGSGPGAQQNTTGNNDEDSDDDEDGRTAAIGKSHKQGQPQRLSRNQKKRKAAKQQDQDIQIQDSQEQPEPPQPKEPSTKPARPARAKSFLDEILADRSKKRKKR